ncbi:MAG: hypothetical protein CMK32_15355 [Porticoccaceae bacterium]|nr:hypothetical protein [Porticoccaceae bacterium]
MRSITFFALLALLAGCQGSLIRPADSANTPALSFEPESDVSAWLNQRQQLCALAPEEQRLRLEALANREGTQLEGDRLERVLLASCRPDLTPGILREALSALQPGSDWTSAQHALVALLWDTARSYQVLETRNTELKNELEKTIDGIRKIEADMEDLNINGSGP